MKTLVLFAALLGTTLMAPTVWAQAYYRSYYRPRFGPSRPRVTYHVYRGGYVRYTHYAGYGYAEPVFSWPRYYYGARGTPYYAPSYAPYAPAYAPHGGWAPAYYPVYW
jgi:hypothetical protein